MYLSIQTHRLFILSTLTKIRLSCYYPSANRTNPWLLLSIQNCTNYITWMIIHVFMFLILTYWNISLS
jgi:hypothetical protein